MTVYANNAGTSWPKPDSVHAATTRTANAHPHHHAEQLAAARTTVCDFLNIRDSDRFRFSAGCTSALDVALRDLPWEHGDLVITSSLEHHALLRPILQMERQIGISHNPAPYAANTPIDLDFVEDTLKTGRVRLVATSTASNVTGEVLPVREIADLAHRHGALLLLDAAQTVGILPLDVEETGADILAFGGHKGLLGPQGVGGFWARPGVRFVSGSTSCELGASDDAAFPDYCDLGGANVAGAVGVAAGIGWLTAPDAPELGEAARGLADQLRVHLQRETDCTVFGSDHGERTATLSIQIPGLALEDAEQSFLDRGVTVRAGTHCAPSALHAIGSAEGTVRISFGPMNRKEDLPIVVGAIEELAAA